MDLSLANWHLVFLLFALNYLCAYKEEDELRENALKP